MQISVGGHAVHYELDGPSDAPVVMFSHSLGAALGMWDPQISAFRERHRVLRYDLRGHGESAAPPGPYSLDDLSRDVIRLLDALAIDRVSFVGVSLGGMIAQLLALTHPERLDAVVFVDTFSDFPEEADAAWEARIRSVLADGMEPHVEPAMQRWFTPGFREARADVVDRIRAMVRGADPRGYAGCAEAIRALRLGARLHDILVPALIVAGSEDPGVSPEMARAMHERIPGSELCLIDDASHLCSVEQAVTFNQVVLGFLAQTSARSRRR